MSEIFTKSKLYAKLKYIPTKEVREETNKIVAKSRNIPLKEAKFKHYLRPNEVLLIKKFFGVDG